ncbi:MAG: TadE/TadG family type IV pilus assembly protein [Beijerinckiaceae bacterium]
MANSAKRRLHALKTSVTAFKRDNRGVTALMFAVSTVMLLTAVGAGVDMSRALHAKTKLQAAADAAALLAKRREIELRKTKTPAEAQALAAAAARQLFAANVQDLGMLEAGTVSAAVSFPNAADAEVMGSGRVNYAFAKFVGADFAVVQAKSVATLGEALPVEVALVLDNTASMFATDGRPKTRFTLLRDAAKSFTHKLFDAAQLTNQNFIRVSVVPWATTVNILSEAPAAADFTGAASVTSIADYGSRTTIASPIDRTPNLGTKVKNSDFSPTTWRGCIEGTNEKIDDYTTNMIGGQKWDALWIQPRPATNASFEEGKNVWGDVTSCTYSPDCYVSPPPSPPPPGTQGFLDLLKRAVPQVNPAIITGKTTAAVQQAACTTTCSTVKGNVVQCDGKKIETAPYCWQDMGAGRWNKYRPADTNCTWQWGCYAPGTKLVTETARACVADPNEDNFLKVDRTSRWCSYATVSDWTKQDAIAGPNVNCPVPMLGLSGNRKQILASLDRMYPVPGGTHGDVGLRWGLRTLAGTDGWDSFFKLTSKPGDFKTGASKVMLLITDGENTRAVDYLGYWGCGSDDAGDTDPQNPGCTGGVKSKNPLKSDLDTHMLKWCESIRTTYGIRLITVAVNITNMAAVDLLKQCAGGAKDAYSVDAADLDKLLSDIAEGSILNLRLKS